MAAAAKRTAHKIAIFQQIHNKKREKNKKKKRKNKQNNNKFIQKEAAGVWQHKLALNKN